MSGPVSVSLARLGRVLLAPSGLLRVLETILVMVQTGPGEDLWKGAVWSGIASCAVDRSLSLRHALGFRQFQQLRRRLTETASQGSYHALPQTGMRVEVDDGVQHGRSLLRGVDVDGET